MHFGHGQENFLLHCGQVVKILPHLSGLRLDFAAKSDRLATL
jgi:hypothetical protein